MAGEFVGLERVRAQHVARFKSEVMRVRLDHRWLADGRMEAILTVTLPNNHEMRFTADIDPKDLLAYALRFNDGSISGFSLGKLWKGVKKVAKGVVTSKVFKIASTALAVAAPVLGPLAPAALAASGAMKAGRALIAAKAHITAGNKGAAQKLVQYAAGIAKTPTVFSASASMATNATGGKKPAPLLTPARAPSSSASKTPFLLFPGGASSQLNQQLAAVRAKVAAQKPNPWAAAAAKAEAQKKAAALRATAPALKARAVIKPAPKASPAKASANVVRLGSPESKIYALLLKPA